MGFRERYAKCQRYSDTGRVVQGGKLHCTFTTRFDREQDTFAFAFRETEKPFEWTIDANGTTAELNVPPELAERIPDPFLGQPHTLMLAIAALTGVSGASAIMIPLLLFPDRLPDVIRPKAGYVVDPATLLVVRFLDPELETEIEYEPVLED